MPAKISRQLDFLLTFSTQRFCFNFTRINRRTSLPPVSGSADAETMPPGVIFNQALPAMSS